MKRFVDRFIAWNADRDPAKAASPLVKIVQADDFSASDRWDIARFWTEEELVKLGVQAAAVERSEFIDDAIGQIEEIATDLASARAELAALSAGPTVSVSLSDETLFTVRSGERVRNEDIEKNRGDVPVFSCFK